jgi:hypothetical protein
VVGVVVDVPLPNGDICPASAPWLFVDDDTHAR